MARSQGTPFGNVLCKLVVVRCLLVTVVLSSLMVKTIGKFDLCLIWQVNGLLISRVLMKAIWVYIILKEDFFVQRLMEILN